MAEIKSSSISIDDLTAPEFSEFLSYWDAARGNRMAPSWSDVELLEMPARVLPYLTVVDVYQAPLDFVYSFYGTGHLALKARDMTGCSVMEAKPAENRGIVFEQYRRVVETGRPMAFIREFSGFGVDGDLAQTTMRLPLSENGEIVQRVMSLSDLHNCPDMRGFYEIFGRERPIRTARMRHSVGVA